MSNISRRRWALANPWKHDLMCGAGLILFMVAGFIAMSGLADVGCWLGWVQCPI